MRRFCRIGGNQAEHLEVAKGGAGYDGFREERVAASIAKPIAHAVRSCDTLCRK